MPQHRVSTHYRTNPDGERVRVRSYDRHHDGAGPEPMSKQAREVLVVSLALVAALLYLGVEIAGFAATVLSVLTLVVALAVAWWLTRSDNPRVRRLAKKATKNLRGRLARKVGAGPQARIHLGPDGYVQQELDARGRWVPAKEHATGTKTARTA